MLALVALAARRCNKAASSSNEVHPAVIGDRGTEARLRCRDKVQEDQEEVVVDMTDDTERSFSSLTPSKCWIRYLSWMASRVKAHYPSVCSSVQVSVRRDV